MNDADKEQLCKSYREHLRQDIDSNTCGLAKVHTRVDNMENSKVSKWVFILALGLAFGGNAATFAAVWHRLGNVEDRQISTEKKQVENTTMLTQLLRLLRVEVKDSR